ncbi:hypothetical protein [Actinoplanes sp. CA-252034]|uniref:hypothetical protein n=1 Tax=Actinoplanes sp. CA-252034 TaxID=3239906 RepID=UPI003D9585F4
MAERAQCVITDGRHSEIFYTRWGAAALDIDLIAGPDAAVRQVRRLYGTDESLREPVWIEAAALIDTSRRLLAVFGWHFEGYAHRAALHALLAQTWPGWDLRWAYAGVEDIARYSGVPAQPADRAALPAAIAIVDPAELDEADTLVTVIQKDRTIRGYGLWTDTTDAFWAGPALVDRLSVATPVPGLPVFPSTGLHLDPVARTAVGWTTLEIAGLAAGWSRHWPGWRLDFQQDRFEEQLAAVAGGLTLPAPTLDAGLDVLARRLTDFRSSPETAYRARSPADHRLIEAAIERARRAAPGPPRWPGLST